MVPRWGRTGGIAYRANCRRRPALLLTACSHSGRRLLLAGPSKNPFGGGENRAKKGNRARGAANSSPGAQSLRFSPATGTAEPATDTGVDLITTTADLAATCSRMSRHEFVTVDTEFLRETTYYPLLCVAQMATADEAVVIDALSPELNLGPFFELMANERVLKVFHAARQDVEIVWHQASLIPHPIFDTQVAAMVLGYGDSISYDQLVQRVTGDLLDKSLRFTDWSRRPLSAAQIAYAISDVTHLREVFLSLSADLRRRGRSEWVGEEMEILTSPATYRAEPQTAWERLKTRARKPRELSVLMEVAAWREREAQSRDVPRGRVLKDEAIGDIATHAPTTPEKLAALRSLPRGFERSKWGADILEAVKRALARNPATLPRLERPRQNVNGSATVELLKVLLRMTSERHGVAAKVIATVDDLERIAGDDGADVPALHGWRRELFGNQAIALKHGKLALAVEKGRVVLVERPS
jgi:ribonuclease D